MSRQKLHIAVTGARGLIGSALCKALDQDGHRLTRLVRHAAASADELQWDPATGILEPNRLSGVDAVIHLAGENIAGGRWTQARREEIRHSRVDGTRVLVGSLASMDPPPGALLCASATGFYGHRGAEILTETSSPGTGFLADLCRDWEQAAAAATAVGTRVVNLRFGVVLSSAGGALGKMLTPFRLGLGGPLGDGQQYLSWIDRDDAVRAIERLVVAAEIRGPVNLVAPQAVTNEEFTHQLARAVHRPAIFRVPRCALRLAFGPMADETLLASTRVAPVVLEQSGFVFQYPRLEESLGHLL